jgi:hypothetical protein
VTALTGMKFKVAKHAVDEFGCVLFRHDHITYVIDLVHGTTLRCKRKWHHISGRIGNHVYFLVYDIQERRNIIYAWDTTSSAKAKDLPGVPFLPRVNIEVSERCFVTGHDALLLHPGTKREFHAGRWLYVVDTDDLRCLTVHHPSPSEMERREVCRVTLKYHLPQFFRFHDGVLSYFSKGYHMMEYDLTEQDRERMAVIADTLLPTMELQCKVLSYLVLEESWVWKHG